MIEPRMLTPSPSSKQLKSVISANAVLDLPRSGMFSYVFAFDIDGTLRNNEVDQTKAPVANEPIHTLLIILRKYFKNIKIVVWSGSGELYARQVGAAFGLDTYVWQYMSKQDYEKLTHSHKVIAVDDIQDTALGDVANLIVRMK